MKQCLRMWLVSALLLTLATSCRHDPVVESPERFVGRAVYYWKGVFDLSPEDTAWIDRYQVGRIYMRFFDVTCTENYEAVPSGTVAFRSSVPQGVEVVPTVFVTLEAMRRMKGREQNYADKICNRILAMCKAHGVADVREVQLDCDWTKSVRESFYELCSCVRQRLQDENIRVSATIRLHQLTQPIPPVDCGVLMLYNTGSVTHAKTRNSILSLEDVQAYLKEHRYDLPLDFAYPVFSWCVAFREGEFRGLVRISDEEFDQATWCRHTKDNWYEVTADAEQYGVTEGDMLRREKVDFAELMAVKEAIEKHWGKTPHAHIIYHLDQKACAQFTDRQIEQIYE